MKLKKADNGNIQILENDDSYSGLSFSDRLIVSGLDTKTDGGGVIIAFGNKNDSLTDIIRKDDVIELIRGNASIVDPSLLTLEEFAEELDTNFFFSKLTPAPLIPSNRTVNQFADLPSPAIDYDGQYWLVDLVQGSNWLLNRREPGIYKSVGGAWGYRGADVPAYFRDDQLLFTDDGGSGEMTFALDNLTARRNISWQDKNIIPAGLSDLQVVFSAIPPADVSKLWFNSNNDELYYFDVDLWVTVELFKLTYNRQAGVSNNEFLNIGNSQGNLTDRGYPLIDNIRIYYADWAQATQLAGQFFLYLAQNGLGAVAVDGFVTTLNDFGRVSPTGGILDVPANRRMTIRWSGALNRHVNITLNYRKIWL